MEQDKVLPAGPHPWDDEPQDSTGDQWEVLVGNLGSVYRGNSEAVARQYFVDYLGLSQAGIGRAAYEPVTLCRNGDPL